MKRGMSSTSAVIIAIVIILAVVLLVAYLPEKAPDGEGPVPSTAPSIPVADGATQISVSTGDELFDAIDSAVDAHLSG